ncbi:MAG: exosortase system-associated protein, TIGR04073 family [candidate division NC10 bacterium]|nr:exosortase system-associated protein, TIGR04073 family [candidate division NC10 bacterium]
MYRKSVAPLILLMSLLVATPVFAIEAGQYATDAGTKLGRGVVNAATGWVEIPRQSVIGGKENGVLGGFGGFFKGIGLGVARTLAGAFEIATFWIPVPERFEPVMQPPTVFEDESPPRASVGETTGSGGPSRGVVADNGPAQNHVPQAEDVSGEGADRVPVPPPIMIGPAQETPLRDIFFDSDSASLRGDAREVLLTNAKWLRMNPHVEVTIEGHCDESGKSEYNQVLGYRRARAVRDFLVASGVATERISIVSYGNERPFVFGSEESWRRWNRRAHLVVTMALQAQGPTLMGEEP